MIDTAVAQLFDTLGAPSVDDDLGSGEYRMEELARLAGTTTRNIRLYRDRGLLDAPQRIGRLAIYSDRHLDRLRLINRLLRRGFTIANVRELLAAHHAGDSLADVLGLPDVSAATTAWAVEQPQRMPLTQAHDLIADPPAFERLTALGLIAVDGDTATVTRPALIETFNQIRAHGITLDKVLDIHEQVLDHIGSISDVLVHAGVEYGASVMTPSSHPSDDAEFAEVVSTLISFGPLAVSSINGTLTACIQGATQAIVGRMLSEFVEHSANHPAQPHLPAAPNLPRSRR